MTDGSRLLRVRAEVRPDEIYNLAAQSHVQVSFQEPEYTAQSDAVGVLRILELVRGLGMSDHVRIYQASTSELYGDTPAHLEDENVPRSSRFRRTLPRSCTRTHLPVVQESV